MKSLVKRSLVIAALVTSTTIAVGQPFNLAVSHNVATPVSNSFKEYVNNTSLRGFQAAVLYNLNNDFRIGLQVSFNDFYKKYPRQVYKTTEGADLSAVLSNTLQNIPILAKGEYSFIKNGWIRPYAGLGAGLNLINYSQFVGEFEYSKSHLKPAFTGDLGVFVPFKKSATYGIRLSTSYNYSPLNEEEINNINTWNAQLGVVIPLR